MEAALGVYGILVAVSSETSLPAIRIPSSDTPTPVNPSPEVVAQGAWWLRRSVFVTRRQEAFDLRWVPSVEIEDVQLRIDEILPRGHRETRHLDRVVVRRESHLLPEHRERPRCAVARLSSSSRPFRSVGESIQAFIILVLADRLGSTELRFDRRRLRSAGERGDFARAQLAVVRKSLERLLGAAWGVDGEQDERLPAGVARGVEGGASW